MGPRILPQNAFPRGGEQRIQYKHGGAAHYPPTPAQSISGIYVELLAPKRIMPRFWVQNHCQDVHQEMTNGLELEPFGCFQVPMQGNVLAGACLRLGGCRERAMSNRTPSTRIDGSRISI